MEHGRVNHTWCIGVAMVCWLGAEMEVVDGMHAGQSQ